MAKSKKKDDTAALKQTIVSLRAEVASQQKIIDTMSKKNTPKKKFRWQTVLAWLCLAIATALLVVGNMFFWVGNTVVNTDRYVAAVGPLITKPEIQSGIAQYTTDQIFKNVDVQDYVQQALPPKADFLAPQITSQLETHTKSSIQKLLANPKVQDYWYSSLTRRHEALIKFSKSYEGNGTIEVSDIYSQLSQRLSDTKLSFLANKKLPADVGSIKVATAGWLPVLHKVSKNIGMYQAVTTLLLIGFSALAVFLSSRRRRMVIALGLYFATFMFATLLAVRIGRGIAVSEVASTYQSAVQVAYTTVLHSFVVQTFGLLLIGLLISLVAWISGPYKSATLVKGRTNEFLSGRLHQTLFGDHENGLTRFVGKHKRLLQWGSVLVIAIIMVLVQLSPALILIYALLMLFCVLLVELLAAS